MAVSQSFLKSVKAYCKIDFDFEDELIIEMIESAREQICFAIKANSTYDQYDHLAKFRLAVKKQVKEEYEHRGLSADSMRYSLANGVLNIIHQLRLEEGDDVHT